MVAGHKAITDSSTLLLVTILKWSFLVMLDSLRVRIISNAEMHNNRWHQFSYEYFHHFFYHRLFLWQSNDIKIDLEKQVTNWIGRVYYRDFSFHRWHASSPQPIFHIQTLNSKPCETPSIDPWYWLVDEWNMPIHIEV